MAQHRRACGLPHRPITLKDAGGEKKYKPVIHAIMQHVFMSDTHK